jgi:photosystem II stability/assembly factor-like uncharacterized protein
MKASALILAIALLASPAARAAWTLQQGNGDQNTIYVSAGAGSPSVAAAMGYNNSSGNTQVLYSRTEDGDTWVEGGFAQLGSTVEFTDASTGYMGGLLGKVWRTADGGATWAELSDAIVGGTLADAETIVDIAFSDDGLVLLIIGATGRCSYSEDGGTTWTRIDVDLPAGEDLAVTAGAIRGERIWLVGGRTMTAPTEAAYTEEAAPGNPASSGFVLRSEDSGASFSAVASGLDYQLADISFVNPDEGWSAAATFTEGGGAIGITSDGGETWEFVSPPDLPEDEIAFAAMGASTVLGACLRVSFFGRLVGVAGGTPRPVEYDGANGLYLTTDGGATWVIQTGYKAAFTSQLVAMSAIIDTAFPDCHRGWLVGEGKVIMRWDNDDTALDCAMGGAPGDDLPEDAADSGSASDCGCAEPGAAERSGFGLVSALLSLIRI